MIDELPYSGEKARKCLDCGLIIGDDNEGCMHCLQHAYERGEIEFREWLERV